MYALLNLIQYMLSFLEFENEHIIEKINFFIVFGVFSTIETFVCVRILNKI